MMKGKSLSIQIWMWFTVIIVGISVCLALVFYLSLENFFEEQVYAQIEAQQKNELVLSEKIIPNPDKRESVVTDILPALQSVPTLQTIPATSVEVQHAYMPVVERLEPRVIADSVEAVDLEPSIQMEIIEQAKLQNSETQRYEKAVGTEKLMYVISKQEIENKPAYVYSFAWENFNDMVLSQFWFVFVGIMGVSLLLLLPARIIANRITKPLVALEGDMQRIANRDWQQPIQAIGPREVLNLSQSCERMRKQLIIHDENQQALMQSISHELKTPIMVIRSYLQAMKDGYNPKGSLEGSLEAIDIEAKRLQKKTLDLIYITNLEYMARQKRLEVSMDLKSVVLEVYERLKYKRPDIHWELQLEETLIKGDSELWKVVFENLIQNQLRHSKDSIDIKVEKHDKNIDIRISNNGAEIDANQFEKLFVAFEKGQGGENGLGLTIVKRIVDMYDGRVWAENLNEGVVFNISVQAE